MGYRVNTLLEMWREIRDEVNQRADKIGSPHPVMQSFFESVGWPPDAFSRFVKTAHANIERSLAESRRSKIACDDIPSNIHRIWLTSKSQPSLPPSDYVQSIFQASAKSSEQATLFFWTNSDQVVEHLRLMAADIGANKIIVCDVRILADDPTFRYVERLIVDRKYVLATDVLKLVVLNRFGGIYCDLGVSFDDAVFELLRLGDYGVVVSGANFFQTSFLACRAGADIAQVYLAVVNNPTALGPPFVGSNAAGHALDEVHLFAGPGFTACLMLFLSPLARIVMLPANSKHLTWRSEKSWYGSEPKYGNVLVEGSRPSVLNEGELLSNYKLLTSSVQLFGSDRLLRSRIRALAASHIYFGRVPTEFCKTFFFHGSDKALSWHNYGHVYHFLLRSTNREIRRVLEVGIGTNRPDVASTMGATGIPGASLRAWREFLSQASIVGADLDVGVLFQSERIETYFLDQTDRESIKVFFSSVHHAAFDLIVDDGLHTLVANRILLEEAYNYVAPGGLYVIEDVAGVFVSDWESYMSDADINAAIITLPHQTNKSDNRLILIPGGQRLFPTSSL